MKSFVTGSQAYGAVTNKSDVDLVVFVTKSELEILKKMCDSDDRDRIKGKDSDAGPQFRGGPAASLRFGKLNLLAVTDPIAYAVWLEGTEELKKHSPVPRDAAIIFFDRMRRAAGLYSERPIVKDAMKAAEKDGEEYEYDEPDVNSWDIGDAVWFPRDDKILKGLITEFDEHHRTCTVSCRGVDHQNVRLADLSPGKLTDSYRQKKTYNEDMNL